ncbi:MAG: hypothetical protein JEY99_09570 [Spirochaetales bacterium]|nr:hypothetical protein [Spirochaetales bacterium]
MRTDLTEAVKKYQRYQMDLKTVVDVIAIAVYYYPPMRNKWDEDQCSEFFCYFHSRIAPMIKRFKDQGSPFEALLKVALQYQMKTFASKQKKKNVEERVLTNGNFWEKTLMIETKLNETQEIEDRYEPPFSLIEELNHNDGKRQRLLILLMRVAPAISEAHLLHFITITGYDKVWVEEKLREIRLLSSRIEERKELCRKRKNNALFNVYCIHEQLQSYQSSEERTILIEKLEKSKRTIRNAEKMMNQIPTGPTHKQISEVLNIPKGTVDSGLHYLAQKYIE